MKKLLIISVIITLFGLASCTDNARARHWGGTMTVNLPPNTKLVNATFKEADLWYLYRPAHPNETPETVVFKESSNFGMMNGTILFKESK